MVFIVATHVLSAQVLRQNPKTKEYEEVVIESKQVTFHMRRPPR